MPTVSRSRVLPAPLERVWELIEDPHHLPRWWPQVRRVEGVEEDRFTEVMYTRKGKPVRVDFRIIAAEPPSRIAWEQDIPGTPFERVLAESVIELVLEPEGAATRVTIAQRQRLRGYSRTGGWMLRRATRGKLSEALDGLEQIV